MKARLGAAISGMFLLLTFPGCATMSDVIADKEAGEGTTVVYSVGTDKGWEIATKVLRWEGAETIEEHKDEHYMLTTIGANLISAGSVVGVWIEPGAKGKSKVTVLTKRKMATNIATGLTETTFHDRFQQAVDIVKSGKALPREAP